MTTFETPAYIRIIGFGPSMTDTINRINELGYDGVSATIHNSNAPFTPSDEDRMVILLAEKESAEVKATAKTGFEADLLTLGVFTSTVCEASGDYMDSLTVVSLNEAFDTVKTLLDSIILPAHICFDLSDLRSTLCRTKHFTTLSSTAPIADGLKNLLDNLTDALTEKQKNAITNLVVLLSSGPESTGKLHMSELNHLSNFITELDESIDVIWAVNTDRNLSPEMMKVSLIVAGKNLPL